MRQGELLAFRWRDVDLEQAVIRVRLCYTGRVVGTPTNRERRDVALISDVVELLAVRHNGASIDDLVRATTVMASVTDRRAAPSPLPRNGCRRHRTRPTNERRTFHSFRHTFAKHGAAGRGR
jgi:integrase